MLNKQIKKLQEIVNFWCYKYSPYQPRLVTEQTSYPTGFSPQYAFATINDATANGGHLIKARRIDTQQTEDNNGWGSLKEVEKKTIIWREFVYNGSSEELRKDISGPNFYNKHLNLIFKTPSEGEDVLASLQIREENGKIKIPPSITEDCKLDPSLPAEQKKTNTLRYIVLNYSPPS